MKKLENRMKGETWYYTPCGRRMKQFPEIVKVNDQNYEKKICIFDQIMPGLSKQ